MSKQPGWTGKASKTSARTPAHDEGVAAASTKEGGHQPDASPPPAMSDEDLAAMMKPLLDKGAPPELMESLKDEATRVRVAENLESSECAKWIESALIGDPSKKEEALQALRKIVNAEEPKITVKVKIQDGSGPPKRFRIKRTEPLSKLFGVFAGRANISASDDARYFFGARELCPTETLAEVKLKDGDLVLCRVPRASDSASAPAEDEDDDDDENMPELEPLDDDAKTKKGAASAKKQDDKTGSSGAAADDDDDDSDM